MAPQRIQILGIPVDAVTAREAAARIRTFLTDGKQHQVATPNPEMLVEASRNPEFAGVLRAADLSLADGAGLLWAARKLGTPLPERVTGTDMVALICGQPGVGPVFFLGAQPGVAAKAATELRRQYPTMQFAGAHAGSPRPEDENGIIGRINASRATILFVAYGSPAQEMWIRKNLAAMPEVKVAMGVGGAFDFHAGIQKRAPRMLRDAGLEWAWRLVRQPWRYRRILNAVVVFPRLCLRHGSDAPV